MKFIRGITIYTGDLPASSETRGFTVTGDDGAVFSLKVRKEDGTYYNFNTDSFGVETSGSRLANVEIERGSYTGSITFAVDADGATYTIYLFAEPHFETELSEDFSPENPVLYTTDITQVANVTLTFGPKTGQTGDYTEESQSQTSTSTKSPLDTDKTVIDINWPIENLGTDAKAYGLRRVTAGSYSDLLDTAVLDGYWYTLVTNTVNGAITANTKVVLDSVDNIVVGMKIVATSSGSLSGAHQRITAVDINKSEIEVSTAQTFSDGVTLTFQGNGASIIGDSLGMKFSFSDLTITPTTLTKTIRTAPSDTNVIAVNGTYGVSAGAYIKGFGVINTTNNPITAVSASSSAGTITTTVNQTTSVSVGTILTIIGSASIYTITGKVIVEKFPAADATISIDLESVLVIGTAS